MTYSPLMKMLFSKFVPIIFLLPILGYFFLYYPCAFNFEVYENGNYLILSLSLIELFLFFLFFFFLGGKLKSNLAFLILIAIVSSFCLFFELYSNEYYCVLSSIFIVYYILSNFQRLSLNALIFLFLLLWLCELVLAIYQIINSNGNSYTVVGTFQNSGVLSIYLVVHFPFLHYFLIGKVNGSDGIKKMSKVFTIAATTLFLFFYLITTCIILFLQSRTSILAMCILTLTLLIQNFGGLLFSMVNRLSNYAIGFLSICLISFIGATGYYLFYFKKLSSFGRLLMIDVASHHIQENFWFGTGIGRFTWYFPQWQASYFQSIANPPKDFFLSAGETYLVFNEYLQLFETIGVFGFLSFVFLLYYFFGCKNSNSKRLLNAMKATIVGILICGFTYYPFHISMIVCLFFFCITGAFFLDDRKSNNIITGLVEIKSILINRTSLVIIIILTGFVSFEAISKYIVINQWVELRNNYSISRQTKYEQYNRIYPKLLADGKFLTEYGKYLSNDSLDYERATSVLEQAKLYFISRETILALGDIYKRRKMYDKAIPIYEWIGYYLPNLFKPKLELLELYLKNGEKEKARKLGKFIMKMPVKIPSEEVDKIKLKVLKLISLIDNSA